MSQSRHDPQLSLQRAQESWALGYQQPWVQRSFTRAQRLQAQPGEIVFLKKDQYLSGQDHECLVKSGHVPERATGHPVIVLSHDPDSTHAVVTTISAYSSSEYNNYLAPWKQRVHSTKNWRDFRAFQGSERPSDQQPHLQLKGGKLMPKPEVSWVYAQCAFVVPITALGHYDKSPTRLCMTQQSLKDLRDHMIKFVHIRTLLQDPRLLYTFKNGIIEAPATPLLPTMQPMTQYSRTVSQAPITQLSSRLSSMRLQPQKTSAGSKCNKALQSRNWRADIAGHVTRPIVVAVR
ncbi:hypothetical protein BKA67DRAFT_663790 [Truncatella angustata]|uniref:Uncharacterized protein n=1 Tax=Truncatella angustata TaxID=152316 RepID=A0A9P8RHF5_9PEZI|nr:uncharacterized protein BKA67DRAFT_663790 [Truncatella angustata]KAH6645912.1 hypothetical protein BKA67DRAFT_663790 [Truncatella angustata]KAH8205296.1 hypothetical protein TruAng_000543 [Truncatella angustata]